MESKTNRKGIKKGIKNTIWGDTLQKNMALLLSVQQNRNVVARHICTDISKNMATLLSLPQNRDVVAGGEELEQNTKCIQQVWAGLATRLV